jgi:hypothetical protein
LDERAKTESEFERTPLEQPRFRSRNRINRRTPYQITEQRALP